MKLKDFHDMRDMLNGNSSLVKLFDKLDADEQPVIRRSFTKERLRKSDSHWRSSLGNSLELLRKGILMPPEIYLYQKRASKWGIHCCLFDSEDRMYGAPPRIHLNTPRAALTISIGPHGRLVESINASAPNAPKRRHQSQQTFLWGYMAIHYTKRCNNVTVIDTQGDYILGYSVCPLRENHRGDCWNWQDAEFVSSPIFKEVT